MKRWRQRGQSMVEYLVAAAVLTALVAVPFGNQPSVLALMLASIREGWVRFLASLSLPI